MSVNYSALMERELEALRPSTPIKLLLHSCCGPCSSAVLEVLSNHFYVTVLYYNPNIQPREEYEKRLFWQMEVIKRLPVVNPVDIMECGWAAASFDSAAEGFENEPEGGRRCDACFRLRLEKTASAAAENGFDYFCTTLTVSPHKDALRINAIGAELGKKYGVRWLPSDFKKREGYKRSVELSKKYGIYRQTYCGCLFSIPE